MTTSETENPIIPPISKDEDPLNPNGPIHHDGDPEDGDRTNGPIHHDTPVNG
jgi:hypothetical protein